MEKLVEIKTPGNNLDLNDSQDEKNVENEDYSEKSQEYQREIDGEYQNQICDEDSTWSEMIRGLDQPSYNLERADLYESENQQESQHNIENSPMQKNDASFNNDSMKISNKKSEGGNNLNDTLSPRRTDPGESKLNMKAVVGNFMLERKKSLRKEKNSSLQDHMKEFHEQNNLQPEVQNDFKDITFKPSKEYPFEKFIRDTHVKREDLEQFFSIITLLNRFTLEGEKNAKAQAMEDRTVSEVLKNMGYQLSASKKNKDPIHDSDYRIKCTHTGYIVDYRVVGVNFFSHTRDRISIVFEDLNHSVKEGFLLVKGSDKSMQNLLKMNEKDKNLYRELLANYKTSGLKQIVYGIKKLTPDRVSEYRKSYIDIQKSSRDQMESYENLAIEIEKDLSFVGCFGIRDNIVPDAYSLIKLLKDIGMKISILSGDSKENCINVANTLQITSGGINDGNQIFKVISKSTEGIANSIKRIMDQIYDDLKNLNQDEMKVANEESQKEEGGGSSSIISKLGEILSLDLANGEGDTGNEENLDIDIHHTEFRNLTKRTLLIRGESLDTIKNSKFLLSQFKSILIFCGSVIGYQMQPSHKAFIVKILKSVNDRVMAVGDGFNDIGMIREANIGVQVSNADVPVVFSDVVVSNIGLVSELMINETMNLNKNTFLGVFVFSWISFTMGSFHAVFYYNTSQFSELLIESSKLSFFYFLVMFVLIGVFEKRYNQNIMSEFPMIYKEHEIMKNHHSIVMICIIIFSLFEVVIQYWVLPGISLQNHSKEKGFTIGIKLWESITFCINFISGNFKLWLILAKNSSIFTIMICIGCIFCIFLHYIYSLKESLAEIYPFWTPGGDVPLVSSVIICIVLPCYMNWLFYSIAKAKFISPLASDLHKASKKFVEAGDQGGKEMKKFKTEDIKSHLTNVLRDSFQTRLDLKYRVTSLIKTIIDINKDNVSLPGINKITSIDLFNYQVGLGRLTNYIKERVERSRFRDYLTQISRKNVIRQFYFYLVCYFLALGVGMLTPQFRRNYMLDTTIPYMIVCIVLLIWATKASILSFRLYTIVITFGIFSLIITTVQSIFSMNRFELNTHDFYNTRIWYSIAFDLIDSSLLVLLHLFIRLFG